MILILRIIPAVTSVLLIVALEIPIIRPDWFWYIVPVVAVLTLVPAGQLMMWKTDHREFWHFLITPLILLGSALLLLVFINETTVAHIISIVTVVLFGWYLENLFLYYHQTFRYQPYALENTTRYCNLLTVFFFTSALFAARIFLSLNIFLVLSSGIFLFILLTLQLLWTGKISWKRGKFVLLTVSIVMAEMIGAISILPTGYFVSGLLLTIPFYLMMNLIRHIIEGSLDSRVLRRYAVIGIGSIAITVFSAPWK